MKISDKNNIVLKVMYYQPVEKYVGKSRDYTKQRNFVSCKGKYNYLNYFFKYDEKVSCFKGLFHPKIFSLICFKHLLIDVFLNLLGATDSFSQW